MAPILFFMQRLKPENLHTLFDNNFVFEQRRIRKFSKRKITRILFWWKLFNPERYKQFDRIFTEYKKIWNQQVEDYLFWDRGAHPIDLEKECFIQSYLIKKR